MSPFTFKSKAGVVHIRQIEHDDLPHLIELNKKAFPLMAEENVVWSMRQLENHLRVFPMPATVAGKKPGVNMSPISMMMPGLPETGFMK